MEYHIVTLKESAPAAYYEISDHRHDHFHYKSLIESGLQSLESEKYFLNYNRYIKYVDRHDIIYTTDFEIHNEQGPAWIRKVEFRSFEKYFLFGVEYSKKEWENQIQTKLYW